MTMKNITPAVNEYTCDCCGAQQEHDVIPRGWSMLRMNGVLPEVDAAESERMRWHQININYLICFDCTPAIFLSLDSKQYLHAAADVIARAQERDTALEHEECDCCRDYEGDIAALFSDQVKEAMKEVDGETEEVKLTMMLCIHCKARSAAFTYLTGSIDVPHDA